MLSIVSWNIAHQKEPWRILVDSSYDLALLQEAGEPPADIASRVLVDPAPWLTQGAGTTVSWRTAIVNLSRRLDVEWLHPHPLDQAQSRELAVSRAGTLAAAILTPPSGQLIVAASMYALWERPHRTTSSGWIYADASAHRLISDLSLLIGRQVGHRILAAGDLNILHGYGEHKSPYWASRYATIFSRIQALGLSFVGPQAPDGRQPDPWPSELPPASKDVPTYHTNRQTPDRATRQLDFVFASNGLAKHVRTRALNDPNDWGPSDHCRVQIDIT